MSRYAKAILTSDAQRTAQRLCGGEFGKIMHYDPRTRTARQRGGWTIKVVDHEGQVYGRWLRAVVHDDERPPSEQLAAYASHMVHR